MIFEKSLSQPKPDFDSFVALYMLIRKFEGLRLKAYFCPAGVLTCGYGTTGSDIHLNTVWTKEYAEKRMRIDAAKFASAALKLCPNATPKQLCALADFAYNLGVGRLKTSTLRKKFNAGDIEGAKRELMRWNKGGGRVLKGLTLRRQAEALLM